ncbi:hypothetical protein ABW21_db0205650 [Orbilia brochopaga]|nr:hypothetical protein ABW21_db0205650 [Drechslerella brochopaga]
MSSQQRQGLLKLPPELFFEVADHFSRKDSLSIKNTCTRLSTLVEAVFLEKVEIPCDLFEVAACKNSPWWLCSLCRGPHPDPVDPWVEIPKRCREINVNYAFNTLFLALDMARAKAVREIEVTYSKTLKQLPDDPCVHILPNDVFNGQLIGTLIHTILQALDQCPKHQRLRSFR